VGERIKRCLFENELFVLFSDLGYLIDTVHRARLGWSRTEGLIARNEETLSSFPQRADGSGLYAGFCRIDSLGQG
jgi:hypothetical protein